LRHPKLLVGKGLLARGVLPVELGVLLELVLVFSSGPAGLNRTKICQGKGGRYA